MPIAEQGSVAAILCRALNFVDERLIHHGERVAYLVTQMMQARGGYSAKLMQDMFLLSILHDIGAYKTEEIDKMLNFETGNVWEHSIYGALLIENLTPLKSYSQVIFLHHMDYAKMRDIDPAIREYAQMINLADRIDVFLTTEKRSGLKEFLESHRDTKFCAQVLALFYETDKQFHILHMLDSGGYKYVVERLMRDMMPSPEETLEYLKMLVWVIDFRSAYTATHSVTAACVARRLAQLLGMPGEIVDDISLGALLHDLGKIAVPIEILESESPLTPVQQEVMRNHVKITGEILGKDVRRYVWRMATRHHEKLDGSGYPEGLAGAEITIPERVVAVADTVSALSSRRSYKQAFTREKCAAVLKEMADAGTIDADITETFLNNYENVMTYVHETSAPLERMYRSIRWEYDLSLAQWGV